jgi:hypothetical protein
MKSTKVISRQFQNSKGSPIGLGREHDAVDSHELGPYTLAYDTASFPEIISLSRYWLFPTTDIIDLKSLELLLMVSSDGRQKAAPTSGLCAACSAMHKESHEISVYVHTRRALKC